jgi:hypothetical protein
LFRRVRASFDAGQQQEISTVMDPSIDRRGRRVEHHIDSKDMTMLMPVLTPHGVLTLRRDEEAPELESAQSARLERAFRRGSGHGLLALGADEVGAALPAVLSYWRDFGARYVTAPPATPSMPMVAGLGYTTRRQ